MGTKRESLTPIQGADTPPRRRLDLKGELALALLPTATVLVMLAILEALSQQRLLFASLASSAFLIYLDPSHGTNRVRTLIIAHLTGALAGLGTFWLLGHGYAAAGASMIVTITAMILLDVMHPPAIGTSLIFAFRAGSESDLSLFLLALLIIATLVLLQRAMVWILARSTRHL